MDIGFISLIVLVAVIILGFIRKMLIMGNLGIYAGRFSPITPENVLISSFLPLAAVQKIVWSQSWYDIGKETSSGIGIHDIYHRSGSAVKNSDPDIFIVYDQSKGGVIDNRLCRSAPLNFSVKFYTYIPCPVDCALDRINPWVGQNTFLLNSAKISQA